MAVKTITIDLEAYRLLVRQKKAGESFSQVVKRTFGRHGSPAALLEATSGICFSPRVLESLEDASRKLRMQRPRDTAVTAPRRRTP